MTSRERQLLGAAGWIVVATLGWWLLVHGLRMVFAQVPVTFGVPTLVVRPYWPTSIDSLAAGLVKHTHVEVRGLVTYTRIEEDGDLHIRLRSPSGAVIVAECIPRLPCHRPRVNDTVTVRGISRRDAEHGWYEVHPVEQGP